MCNLIGNQSRPPDGGGGGVLGGLCGRVEVLEGRAALVHGRPQCRPHGILLMCGPWRGVPLGCRRRCRPLGHARVGRLLDGRGGWRERRHRRRGERQLRYRLLSCNSSSGACRTHTTAHERPQTHTKPSMTNLGRRRRRRIGAALGGLLAQFLREPGQLPLHRLHPRPVPTPATLQY